MGATEKGFFDFLGALHKYALDKITSFSVNADGTGADQSDLVQGFDPNEGDSEDNDDVARQFGDRFNI